MVLNIVFGSLDNILQLSMQLENSEQDFLHLSRHAVTDFDCLI
jgi:hypothetical protein